MSYINYEQVTGGYEVNCELCHRDDFIEVDTVEDLLHEVKENGWHIFKRDGYTVFHCFAHTDVD